MSLKTFHLIFIGLSFLLALGFTGWSLAAYLEGGALWDLLAGLVSLLVAVGLAFYGRYVFRKLKDMSYL